MPQEKRLLYQQYSPEAILLGSKAFDCSEDSIKIIQTYCKLSTKFQLASWEQVADELGWPKDKKTQSRITGALTVSAAAYRDLCHQPHPYIVRQAEE